MLALIARYHGLGRVNRAAVAAGQGLILTLAMSVVFGIPPFLYARGDQHRAGRQRRGDRAGDRLPGDHEPGHGDDVPAAAGHRARLRAVGNSIIPLILLGGSNLLNVILDYWFIYGGLGVESMGVAGAAWATVAARGIFAAFGVALLYRGFEGIKLSRWLVRWPMIWTILKIGIPSCIQWLVRMAAYLYTLGFIQKAAVLAGRRRHRRAGRVRHRAAAGQPGPVQRLRVGGCGRDAGRAEPGPRAQGAGRARVVDRPGPEHGHDAGVRGLFCPVCRALAAPHGLRRECECRQCDQRSRRHRTHLPLRRLGRFRVPGGRGRLLAGARGRGRHQVPVADRARRVRRDRATR